MDCIGQHNVEQMWNIAALAVNNKPLTCAFARDFGLDWKFMSPALSPTELRPLQEPLSRNCPHGCQGLVSCVGVSGRPNGLPEGGRPQQDISADGRSCGS